MPAVRSFWPITLSIAAGAVSLSVWYLNHPVAASSLNSTVSSSVDMADTMQALTDTVTPTRSASFILDRGHTAQQTAEGRLIEVLSFLEQGKLDDALQKTDRLIEQYPNFQLAHLVRGDLLQMRAKPSTSAKLDEAALLQFPKAAAQLEALRSEAKLRLDALLHRPPAGTLPSQVVGLTGKYSSHLIAVDASRSRLYLFEYQLAEPADAPSLNSFRLVGDFYVSVGKSGIGKQIEGDGKTPLGIYFVTGVREKRELPDLYGAGALPLNYPNAVDRVLGKTGYGIWLHGTPSHQFVRAPLASDGCVVAANPDMTKLLEQVPLKTTAVIIAESLEWVAPTSASKDRQHLEEVVQAWQRARADPDTGVLKALMSPEFPSLLQPPPPPVQAGKKRQPQPAPVMPDFRVSPEVQLGIADLNLLRWQGENDSFVAVFEETVNGKRTGILRQQHWWKPKNQANLQWQLLQDTTLSVTALERSKMVTSSPAATTTESVKLAAIPSESIPNTSSTPPLSTSPQAVVGDAASDKVTTVNSQETPVSAVGSSGSTSRAIEQSLHAWAQAWSQKNIDEYFNAYAPEFDPPGRLSRADWEKERRERILPRAKIEVDLSQIHIEQRGQEATVRFVQHYRADTIKASSRKTLKLIKQQNRWLITEEIVGG
ncbi:MAG: hypothetical protein RLZZ612_471 [Pseudomonadota bacterium]